MTDTVRLSVWTGPRYLAGSTLVRFLPRGLEVPWDEGRQAATDRLSFEVPVDGVYVPSLAPGTIIQQEYRGIIREWIVETRSRRWASDANAVRVECVPIHHLLRTPPIERRTVGGVPESAVAAVNLSPREMIGTFVVPQMAYWGLDIFRTGLVQVATRDTVSMTGWTPMQLLDWLAERHEAGWDLRADDASQVYRIDFGPDLLADDPVLITLREGRTLADFAVTDGLADLHTALMVRGGLPEGGDQPATIADAVFRVQSVVADGADDLITVILPGGGSPVIEDGQHVGHHLLAANLTTQEILGSTSPGTFRVANGAAFAANDLVQMVATADRDGITYLVSPLGVAASGLPVPVLGVYDMEGRGERGWARDPYFTMGEEPAARQVFACERVDSTNTSTPTVTKLPPNMDIPVGSWAVYKAGAIRSRRVTAAATTDGTGQVQLTLNGPFDTNLATGQLAYIVLGPQPWADAFGGQSGVISAPTFPRPSDSMDLADLSCTFVGFTATGGDSLARATYSGLTAGDVIYPGDRVDTPAEGYVIDGGTANGSGEVSVLLLMDRAVDLGAAGGGARTVFRPSVTVGDRTGRVMFSFQHAPTTADRSAIIGESARSVIAKASGSHVAIAGLWITRPVADTGEYVWGTVNAQVRRGSDGTLLAQATTTGDTLAAGVRTLGVTLRVPIVVTADEDAFIQFRRNTTADNAFFFLRVAQIQSGPDVSAPETASSHANRMYAEAQRRLSHHRYGLRRYRAGVADLARSWDLPTTSLARLRAGARVVVDAPSADQKLTLRVERVTRAEDPRDTVVEFETLAGRFTRSVRATSGEAFGFVDVRFTEGLNRQTLLVRSRPPTTGLPAASVPDVDDTPDDPFAGNPSPPELLLNIAPPE